ncbi:MAG: YigZ family protein [Bacteroidales bacterium]|nr:YigZ family protein [Bacteroidales bacterium]
MPTTDTYRTLATPAEGIYKEKGSRFLAFAYPVADTSQVKSHLDQLRKQFFDARHHCYAYRLGPLGDTFRAVDDGEPSGTGGRPIHGQLLSADLTDTLIVVVRYFGGILLGTSHLSAAYREAARDAIAQAQIIERTIDRHYLLTFPYESMNDIMRLLRDLGLKPTTQPTYADQLCTLPVAIRLSLTDRFLAAASQLRSLQLTPLPAPSNNPQS